MSASEAQAYLDAGHFAPGSMRPKIEACLHFVRQQGSTAVITDPAHLSAALDGRTGTRVTA
jgi:carbamate kinase